MMQMTRHFTLCTAGLWVSGGAMVPSLGWSEIDLRSSVENPWDLEVENNALELYMIDSDMYVNDLHHDLQCFFNIAR